MARRIKSRKRKHLGNRTYGGGNTKNRRGKGNKGGKGNAGFHKHKWMRTIKRGEHKNRKYGFHSVQDRLATITLEKISAIIAGGRCEKEGDAFKLVFKDTRVVGTGALSAPAIVHATGFSEGARRKIEAAGGRAVSFEVKSPKKVRSAAKSAQKSEAKSAAKSAQKTKSAEKAGAKPAEKA